MEKLGDYETFNGLERPHRLREWGSKVKKKRVDKGDSVSYKTEREPIDTDGLQALLEVACKRAKERTKYHQKTGRSK